MSIEGLNKTLKVTALEIAIEVMAIHLKGPTELGAHEILKDMLEELQNPPPNERIVTVGPQGVQFGKAWISHEKITGRTAAELGGETGGIIAKNYTDWLQGTV